jgi:hypothetical protein
VGWSFAPVDSDRDHAADQVPEAIRRVQPLAHDPDMITGEVGRCMLIRAGMPSASYVLTATFADRAAFDRHAASDEHRELLAWALPRMLEEQIVVHEVATAKDVSGRPGEQASPRTRARRALLMAGAPANG